MAVWIALGAAFMGLATVFIALLAARAAKKNTEERNDARR